MATPKECVAIITVDGCLTLLAIGSVQPIEVLLSGDFQRRLQCMREHALVSQSMVIELWEDV